MFAYYLQNAGRSIRRNPALSLLVVAAIMLGISVSMTMLSLYYVMGSNPIPHKSDKLFAVQLDAWNPLAPFDADQPERPPHQLTWQDATNLLHAAAGKRQVAMFEARLIVQPEDAAPFESSTRVTSSDFFPMFDVPFLYGGGWSRQEEANGSPRVVLTQKLNERLFAGSDPVGNKLRINNRVFTVSGVIDTFEPVPRFYDVINNPVEEVADIFVPLSQSRPMEISSAGSDWGWKSENIVTYDDWLASESVWLQYWVELDSRSEQQAYLAHLDAYASEQKALGRFARPLNNAINDVMAWMAYHEVVPKDVSILVGLGFLFLVVCLLSSISLLLTKFTSRAGEMSLRRALGANRLQIIYQNLVEVTLLGAVGGLLGTLLAQLSLLAIQTGLEEVPAALFKMDWVMVGIAVSIAVFTSLLAGVYPAVKACAIAPAQQLKA